MQVALQARPAAFAGGEFGAGRAGENLVAHHAEQRLGRVGLPGVQTADFREILGQSDRPTRCGQGAGGLQGGVERCFQLGTPADQLVQPPPQAAGAGGAALGT